MGVATGSGIADAEGISCSWCSGGEVEIVQLT